MTVICTSSALSDATENARELAAAARSIQPTFILFFVSSELDPVAFGRALGSEFGSVPSIGCTTAGELSSGKMSKGSSVMMAFDSDSIREAHVGSIDDCSNRDAVLAAVDTFEEAIGAPVSELNPTPHVGLVIHDGMTASEELVMSVLSEASNVPFVGGTAGDDLKFQATHTFVNFEVKSKAAVLALLKPTKPYRVLKTQSFRSLGKLLVATDVDEENRTVRCFNGKPALAEYAAQLGVSPEQAPTHFLSNPLGLVLSTGEPFVRAPAQTDGSAMTFYCQIKRGMELSLLEAGNIVEQTRRDLAESLRSMGEFSAVLNFHCILRTLQLQADGMIDEYGKVFSDIPTVGFSTYGESYIGHMNQTSTMILFG